MGTVRLRCATSSEESSDRGDADADPRERGEIFSPKLTKPDAVLTAPQKRPMMAMRPAPTSILTRRAQGTPRNAAKNRAMPAGLGRAGGARVAIEWSDLE
jgi:hypothetical protein